MEEYEFISKGEMAFMEQVLRPVEKLDYPLVDFYCADGSTVQIYDLPNDATARRAALLTGWPFDPVGLNEEFLDLHTNTVFRFRDADLIRHAGFNMVVAPKYILGGGMAVDFMPIEHLSEDAAKEIVKDRGFNNEVLYRVEGTEKYKRLQFWTDTKDAVSFIRFDPCCQRQIKNNCNPCTVKTSLR